MKDMHNVVHYLFHRDIDVLPGIQNPGSGIFEDLSGNIASRLIKDIGKVVLRQQRVCRVGAMRVSPRFILVLSRCINDTSGSGLQRLRCCVDDRADKGRQERHNEDRHGLADLFD